MGALIDAVLQFFDIVWSLIEFVIQLVMDLIYVIGLFAQLIAKIPEFFGWLPTAVASTIVVTISVLIILRICGRDG